MSKCTELWVDRKQYRNTRIVSAEVPTPREGEVLVAIDRFGLTSNNVSYAVSGDMIGYWGSYPAEGNWGKVPVWGCANVVQSNCAEVPVKSTVTLRFGLSTESRTHTLAPQSIGYWYDPSCRRSRTRLTASSALS